MPEENTRFPWRKSPVPSPASSWLGRRDVAIHAVVRPSETLEQIRKADWIATGLKAFAFDEDGLDCGSSEIVIGFQGMEDRGFIS